MKKRFLMLSVLCAVLMTWNCEQNELNSSANPEAYNMADSTQLLNWVQSVTRFPHRHLGTQHWRAAVQSVKQALQKLGYAVKEDRFPVYAWECQQYALKVQSGNSTASFDCYYEYWSGFTPQQGVSGDLVYIGNSLEPNTEEVSGKIVLADMPFSLSAGEPNPFVRLNHLGLPEKNGLSALDLYWRCHKRGAKGTIFILSNSLVDDPRYMWPCMDSIPWPMPSLLVGKKVGEQLKALTTQTPQATLTLTGAAPRADGINLWAELPGKSDSTLLVLTHLDAPFSGAIEDGSGIASVLSQAKAWKAQNPAARPYRMVFVFTAGHFTTMIGGARNLRCAIPTFWPKPKRYLFWSTWVPEQ